MRALPVAPRPECASVRWFEPDEEIPLVFWGSHGKALEQLALELAVVDRFLEASIDPPTRILFAGPSGTGKTLAARWLALRLKKPLAVFDVAGATGMHLGDTARNLKNGFDAAEQAGSIVFLDEIDALCARRTGSEKAAERELERATSSLFQRLDWLKPDVVVIAATNFADSVDPALTRRLPTRVDFTLPDVDARRALVEQLPASKLLSPDVVDDLVGKTLGCSAADVRARVMTMARERLLAEPPAKRRRESTVAGVQSLLQGLEGGPYR